MTSLSPYSCYTNVNFNGINKPNASKPQTSSTNPLSEKKEGMSKSTKIAIGLGAVAVATAVIATLALKKKNPINIDSKKLFESGFGKIEEIKGNIELDDIVSRAKSVISKAPNCTQTALFNLDEKGIDLLNKNMKVNISKDLFKNKNGLLLQFFDKNSNLIQSKPIVADSVGKSISELFTNFPCTKLV